ncbi:MAG: hypothetical protein D6694_07065, partial [Gammaproteobacteria bacterium]
TTGQIAYTLTCRGGTEVVLDRLTDEIGVNYIGPWMCILNEGAEETEAGLIGPRELPVWMGRNVFTRKALERPCMDDPYYGRKREFALRGMKLELGFEQVERGKPLTVAAVFHVRVRRDPSATSQIADAKLPKAEIVGCGW